MPTLAAHTSDVSARPLFSWPPHPALTAFQLAARGALLLNNIIGIGLCFAAGAEHNHASVYVGGSFMVAACLLVPGLLCWNLKMLRKSSTGSRSGYEQLESDELQAMTKNSPRTHILKVAAFIDFLGFVSFVVIYPITVKDAQYSWYGTTVLMSYATVSCLIAL